MGPVSFQLHRSLQQPQYLHQFLDRRRSGQCSVPPQRALRVRVWGPVPLVRTWILLDLRRGAHSTCTHLFSVQLVQRLHQQHQLQPAVQHLTGWSHHGEQHWFPLAKTCHRGDCPRNRHCRCSVRVYFSNNCGQHVCHPVRGAVSGHAHVDQRPDCVLGQC